MKFVLAYRKTISPGTVQGEFPEAQGRKIGAKRPSQRRGQEGGPLIGGQLQAGLTPLDPETHPGKAPAPQPGLSPAHPGQVLPGQFGVIGEAGGQATLGGPRIVEAQTPAQGADGRLAQVRRQQRALDSLFPEGGKPRPELGQVVQVGAVPERRVAPGGGNLPGPGYEGLLTGITPLPAVVAEFREAEGIKFPHHVVDPEAPGQGPGRGQLSRHGVGSGKGDGGQPRPQGLRRRRQQET